MKPGNPMAEDMFERAREAFFGTAKTLAKANAPSTELIKLRSEPSPEEVTGSLPDKPGAAQPEFHSASQVDTGADGGASSGSYAVLTWSWKNRDRDWYSHDDGDGQGPTHVPESRSLWLLLSGWLALDYLPTGVRNR